MNLIVLKQFVASKSRHQYQAYTYHTILPILHIEVEAKVLLL